MGVTLLFTLARGNGTLDQIVRTALRGCQGNAGLIPIVFFGLSLTIASIGAGNIAAAALIAPLAMAVAERAKIPPFLMTLMVAHGCVAGALSPIAPTGIIANGLMARMGMSGFERQNYLYNLMANTLAAGMGFLAFGGWRLFARFTTTKTGRPRQPSRCNSIMTIKHWVTLATIALVVVGVVGFHVHVGMGAFAAAVVLPWPGSPMRRKRSWRCPGASSVMVSGVTVLTSLLEKTGGIDLFTTFLARFATHRSR